MARQNKTNKNVKEPVVEEEPVVCLLYTSDAADE